MIKKADKLARFCDADVALIIRRDGRYYTYCSIDYKQWPPSLAEIINVHHFYTLILR